MIVGVAIRLDGLVYALPRPARHHNFDGRGVQLYAHWDEPELYGERATQGFVDHYGCFLNRVDAYQVAKANGQLIPRAGGYRKGEVSEGPELFSEDLW